MLLSTRAGGVGDIITIMCGFSLSFNQSAGLNLQAADIVVLVDGDWNPQMDLQVCVKSFAFGGGVPCMFEVLQVPVCLPILL
jgi:hypothetical protein